MHIPFPAASSNNTQCPFPSVCRSSRPRRARSRQPSGAPGALVLRAIWGRRDPGERKGERRRRFPLLSQLSGRMYLCFCVVDGKLRLSQAICLACTRDLGHDAVCWGIVWTCFIFTLAFANKKKTLIFLFYFFFTPQAHSYKFVLWAGDSKGCPSFGMQEDGRGCASWGTRLVPLLCSDSPTSRCREGSILYNCPKAML